MKKYFLVLGCLVACIVYFSTPLSVHAAELVNGDFEQGPGVGWEEVITEGIPPSNSLIEKCEALKSDGVVIAGCHGTYTAWLGGKWSMVNRHMLKQTFSVPNSNDEIWLNYRYFTYARVSTCGEYLTTVTINDQVVRSYNMCDSQDTNAWTSDAIDLKPWKGQTVILKYELNGTKAGSEFNVWFDDISVNVHAPATLTVCPSGTAGQDGCQYIGGEGIQQAVDASQNGDTVLIKSGTYTNANPRAYGTKGRKALIIIENKNITIQGSDNLAIIDGSISQESPVNGILVMGSANLNIEMIGVTRLIRNVANKGGGVAMAIVDQGRVQVKNCQFNQNSSGVIVYDNGHLVAEGLTVNESYGEGGGYGRGLELQDSSFAEVNNSQFIGNVSDGIAVFDSGHLIADTISANASYKGLYLADSAKAEVKHSQFSNSSSDGIFMSDHATLSVENVDISSNNRLGIYVYDKTSILTVSHTTLNHNAGLGIGFGTAYEPPAPTTISNSIISNTIPHQIQDVGILFPGAAIGAFSWSGGGAWAGLKDPSRITSSYNLLWQNAAGRRACGINQICDFPGKIEADPLFVDPANGDYRLQPNSPACTGGENGTYMGAFPCDTITDLSVTCSETTAKPPTATFKWKRTTSNPIEVMNLRINMVNTCKDSSGATVDWPCSGTDTNPADWFVASKVTGSSTPECVKNGNTYDCAITKAVRPFTQYKDWSVESTVPAEGEKAVQSIARVGAPGFSCGEVKSLAQCVRFNTFLNDKIELTDALPAKTTAKSNDLLTIRHANSDVEGKPDSQEICWTADGLTPQEYLANPSVFTCVSTCQVVGGNYANPTVGTAPTGITPVCDIVTSNELRGGLSGTAESFIQALPNATIVQKAKDNGLIFVQNVRDHQSSSTFCTTNPGHQESGALWSSGSIFDGMLCGRRQTPTGLSDAEANCTRRITVESNPSTSTCKMCGATCQWTTSTTCPNEVPPEGATCVVEGENCTMKMPTGASRGDFVPDGVINDADLAVLIAGLYTRNCDLKLNNEVRNCEITIADYNEMISILR